MPDFQAATDRFLVWFKSVGGDYRDDLLEICDLRSQDAGRGIIARRDIPEDTILFTIPRDAIINVETSDLVKKLPKVFEGIQTNEHDEYDEGCEPLDAWASLILVMLHEYLQGDASRWKPYIDLLPTTFDTPIFWTDSELEELVGTVLTSEKIGKEQSSEMLRSRILPVVLSNPSTFYPDSAHALGEDELLALAHRIGSTIMSYAFDLDNDKEQSDEEEDGWVEDRDGLTMMGMVPMADILNANADFSAHVNHGESLEVTALRSDTKTGMEVLNYYGPLPSSELLRRYGYVTPEHHRYDVGELSWSLVQSTLGKHLGLSDKILGNAHNHLDEVELEEYFIFERDSGEPTEEGRLTQPAKSCEVPVELCEQMKTYLKALKKETPGLVLDAERETMIYTAVIKEALKIKLTQYPTSAENDADLLARGGLSKRHLMAVEVRLGEKRLFQEALASLVSSEGEERPKKRVKMKA